MTGPNGCPMSTKLGAYVLDALEDAEREQLVEHLRTCESCRRELDQLRSLPSLLARVDAATASVDQDSSEPRPSLPSLVAAARQERRIQRRKLTGWLAVACVAVLLAATGLGVVARETSSEPTQVARPNEARSFTDPTTGVSATVDLTSEAWGTEARLAIAGLTPPLRCQLVARSADGRTEVAGTWAANYRSVADVVVTTSIPLPQLVSLDVLTDAGQPLVKIPIRQ